MYVCVWSGGVCVCTQETNIFCVHDLPRIQNSQELTTPPPPPKHHHLPLSTCLASHSRVNTQEDQVNTEARSSQHLCIRFATGKVVPFLAKCAKCNRDRTEEKLLASLNSILFVWHNIATALYCVQKYARK